MPTGGDIRMLRPAAWLVSFCATTHCIAATLTANVVDEGGQPVANVVVYAVPERPPLRAAVAAATPASTAVMDQKNNAFVPHVLVVQTGSAVLFPNNDTVSHHVYSFSETKNLELPLYKGNAHPPLVFDKPGLVVLGCNIHDSMLGYILVVDTPLFAKTDERGQVTLEGLAAGAYSVHVWTPRVRPADLPASTGIDLNAADARAVAFQLEGKLQPDHEHMHGSSLTWERY
jgi:plastocyanin